MFVMEKIAKRQYKPLNNMLHKLLSVFLIFLTFILIPDSVFGAAPQPVINARAAVLIEAQSGRVLFGRDEHRRVFPAATTKVLTAMVVLDHLDPSEILIAGPEINELSIHSARSGHVNGEHISVHSLLRALFIMTGNDTANILALNVARRVTGNDNISFEEGTRVFMDLMNQKAWGIGALHSHFANSHGYHDNDLFTTAYDMALITRAALEIDFIRELASETSWAGNGAGPNPDPNWLTRNYNMQTANQLLLPGQYFFPDAIGVRTGRTSHAGDVLTAAAERDGVRLIAVIMDATDPARWRDSAALFEYGFRNYSHSVIEGGSVIGEVLVQNPRLQDPDAMELIMLSSFYGFFSNHELENFNIDINFIPDQLENGLLVTPVYQGQILGRATYSIDGRVIYEGYFVAARDAESRSLASDRDYLLGRITAALFTREAVPYWIIAGLSLIIISNIVYKLAKRRRRQTSYFGKF